MFDSTSGDRVSLGRPKGMHNQSSMDADFLHSISSSITQSLHQQIGDIDSNQLFLLQTAFRSLDSFFSTAQVGSQHPHDSVANKILSSTRTEVKTSSYDISKLSALVESSKREGEGMVGAVQLEVLEALLRSQNELRSAQMRVDILEMMQGQALSSSGAGSFGELGDDADEAKESPKDEYLTELSKVPFSEETIDTPEVAGNEKTQSLSMLVSHLPVASVAFDSILAELSILKACLSERASTDFPLGFFLENSNVAVVQSFVRTASAEEKLALDLSPAQSSRKEADTGSKNSQQPFVSLSDMLKDLQRCCSLLSHSTSIKTEDTVEHEKLLAVLAAQEERLAEYRTLVEQTEIERNEFMSMSVELQVLRERNQRISKEEITTRSLETKNNELSRQVKKLEEKLKELQEKNFSVDEVSMKEEERNIEIKNISQQHSARVDTMKLENERLSKENQRLKNAIQVSEQRVMGALQDQMTLHHQLQQMEEEAVAAKANITKLTREYEELRIARNYKEESDHKARELQREINKRDLELIEIREAANLSQKYQEELANAEKVIETLENKLSEYSIELERGRVAISQLDNYREQIRVKTKENRDMSLHIHALETQLKDVPYLQNRFTEVSDELQDCKVKLEKMPAVLSEMSRLRGSSRASVKALVEQDKQLAQLKHRVKLLEKETAVLRNDNRSMQDVEAKLKDANTEISRLMGMVAEVSTLKAGVKHAEEEKKQYEGQYKKMRKFIRQSTVAGITSGPSTPINSGMMKSVMSFGGSANTFSATINETNDPESQLDASSVASVTSEQADLAGGYSEALSRNSGHNNNIPFSQAEVSSGDDGGAGKTAVKSALNDIFAGTVKQ